jgi:hypothetical protein
MVAILAHQHETQTQYCLTATVCSNRTATNFVTNLHICNITNADGYAILGSDDDVFDLFEVYRSTDSVNEQHFASVVDGSTADIFVVGLNCVRNLFKGQAEFE